ncbi:MAG: hypothetical protein ABL982_25220 [Vicinamibacterales bacterium]
MTRLLGSLLVLLALTTACNSAPPADGLRDSFAQQLSSNKFISDFQRSGDNITFKGPRPDGTPSIWRVHIDTVTIEPQKDEQQPYKGTVTSSWFVNGEQVAITGADSNLPIELTSNGLSQECWAFWEAATKRWSWE